jgi:hypothetical protein
VTWLDPHGTVLFALTVGVGVLMTRLGFAKGQLRARARRRHCPCCGRLLSRHGCDRCGT